MIVDAAKSYLQGEGVSQELELLYLNNNGFTFSNQIEGIYYLISDPTILDVSFNNGKLSFITREKGNAQIYIESTENPLLFEVLDVRVGNFVEPSGSLVVHLGDEIAFNNKDIDVSKWSVSNEEVASISPQGYLHTKSEGESEVTIGDYGIKVAHIKVLKFVSLFPSDQNQRQITNIQKHSSYQETY